MRTDLCDLHTHSAFSDGTDTPTDLLRKAELIGLNAIALCDHNTLAGLPEFLSAAKDSNVIAAAGVEITAEFEGREIHIVGLLLPDEAYRPLSEFLDGVRRSKEAVYGELYQRLMDSGYDLSRERIFSIKNGASLNRVSFANELLRCGYVRSVKEAFSTVLSEKRGLYVPSKRADGLEVISLLSSLSVVSVLAHPFLNLDEQTLRRFLPEAKERGLVAIETKYSLFNEHETQLAEELAREHSLLCSGGSDYHGDNKPDISIGTGKGNLAVPVSFYNQLLEASLRLRKSAEWDMKN